jgi:hypothetical protein
VIGEGNKPAGPRRFFARIKTGVEPTGHLAMSVKVKSGGARREGYLDWAVFGLLDLFLTCEEVPLRTVRITLEEVEHHPVGSSPMAFGQPDRCGAQDSASASTGLNKSAPIVFTMGRPFHLF